MIPTLNAALGWMYLLILPFVDAQTLALVSRPTLILADDIGASRTGVVDGSRGKVKEKGEERQSQRHGIAKDTSRQIYRLID